MSSARSVALGGEGRWYPPTDGDSLRLDDTLVTICPWWDGPICRELVARQLITDATHRPARWVWVYHWPPIGSPTCWTGSRDDGDSDLVEWITEHQPDLVLCGHVHQSPFADKGSWVDRLGETWVFNAGNQRGPIPTRIEIDLTAGTPSRTSLMGKETVDLR